MKKKIISLCMVLCLGATAVIGGTLAYFSDKDAQTNTFTTGNVAIDLYENFAGEGEAEKIAELIPATGSAQAGTLKNGIEKEVFVENTGSEDAFVRVHIAIPQILDDGADTFDASANVLHFNYDKNNVGEGLWDWSKEANDGKYTGNWNYYTAQIDNVWYNVYVVTYEEALPGKDGDKVAATVSAMNQVYLDSETTNEDITKIKAEIGDEWHIVVAAEGTQAAGFKTAHEALNAAFGEPGTYTVDWNAVKGDNNWR